jgi:hypothetical protein
LLERSIDHLRAIVCFCNHVSHSLLFDCLCFVYVVQSQHVSGGQRFDAYADFAEGTPPRMRTHANTEAYGHMVDYHMEEDGEVDYHVTKGVTGCSPLLLLPYFDIIAHTLLDMMHIVSGVVGRNLIGMLTGDRLRNSMRNDQKSKEKDERKRKQQEAKEAAEVDRTAKRVRALQDAAVLMSKANPKRSQMFAEADDLLILPRDKKEEKEEVRHHNMRGGERSKGAGVDQCSHSQ